MYVYLTISPTNLHVMKSFVFETLWHKRYRENIPTDIKRHASQQTKENKKERQQT